MAIDLVEQTFAELMGYLAASTLTGRVDAIAVDSINSDLVDLLNQYEEAKSG